MSLHLSCYAYPYPPLSLTSTTCLLISPCLPCSILPTFFILLHLLLTSSFPMPQHCLIIPAFHCLPYRLPHYPSHTSSSSTSVSILPVNLHLPLFPILFHSPLAPALSLLIPDLWLSQHSLSFTSQVSLFLLRLFYLTPSPHPSLSSKCPTYFTDFPS